MLKSNFKLKRHLRRENEPKRLQELNGLRLIKGLESVMKLVFKHVELRRDLDDDIGLAHLTIPIPDPEIQEDIQEDTQETIPEGFEADDPKNWMQEEQVHHSKDWLQDEFVPFEEEDDELSSSDESYMSCDVYY
jgi:hypothetical protein